MKIFCIDDKQPYEIEISSQGENKMSCPKCSHLRTKKNQKSKVFSWNATANVGHCVHCEAKFVPWKDVTKPKKTYVAPKFENRTKLTEKALRWFWSRMISQETLIKTEVCSAVEWMPQFKKEVEVICWPYYRDGDLVNVKYRGPEKSFKMITGAERILLNVDILKTANEVIWVEGEMDYLTYIEAGFENVVSVPNGAATNLDYLDPHIEDLDRIETHYISVDDDEAGLKLREELIRRLSPEKCKIVAYSGFKDVNELMVGKGTPAVRSSLRDATEPQISGVFSPSTLADQLNELFLHGLQPGAGVGMPEIDSEVTWELGRLAVITGIPSHGKSEYLDFIITRLSLLHDWKCAFFSPENHPIQYHISKIAEKFTGKKFAAGHTSKDEYDQVVGYIEDNFMFIAPEDDFTVDTILEKARYLVKTRGIRILAIDPYNKLDHKIPSGYTETQYVSEFLDKLSNFAKRMNVLVFLVAHPTKMYKEGGVYVVPNLYSISGSSNFYNKADYGITVYRVQNEDGLTNKVEIFHQKVKFRHLGNGGKVELMFNYRNGRYELPSFDVDAYQDQTNWIDMKKQVDELFV